MTRHLVVLAAALALSACSGQNASPQASADATATATPTKSVDGQALTAFAYSPFPEGVVLVQPFHVRSDRIYRTKAGAERRRSALELLDGGAPSAAQDVARQMASSGFRKLDVKDKGDGVTRMSFVKKGRGRINVASSSDVGSKPSNPKAVGVITIDWQLAPAPAAEATDKAVAP